MAVAFDALATATTRGFGGFSSPQTNANLTIGGSGTCVVAAINLVVSSGALPTIGVPTWNGVNMTLIGNIVSSNNLLNNAVYGLAAPATGNHTLSVPFTGSTTNANVTIDCFSFSGSDLRSGICFPSVNVLTDTSTPTGTVYPASAFSVSTFSGDIACAVMQTTGAANFPTTTGTLIRNDNVAANLSSAYALASSSATTVQFTGGTSGQICVGVAFRIQQPSLVGGQQAFMM